ncbi:hypothetical protein K8I31_12015, partial [bacterium]|nr:hypothetical protein [bacterium]
MTLYWNQFKALLWKEYRECRPIFWLAIIGAFIAPFIMFQSMPTSRYDRLYQLNDLGSNMIFLIGLQIVYICVLAFILYLPLLSREPERDNLVCLNMKPVAPEMLCLFQWLSGFALALAGLLISVNLVHFLFYGMAYWLHLWIVLSIFIAYSAIFYTASSFTANRLRSFGLLLLVVPTRLMFVSYMTELQRFHPDGLSANILFFVSVNPWLSLGPLVLILALFASAALRLRLTRRLTYWQAYAGAFAGLIVLFFFSMYMNVTDSNVKLAAIKVDGNILSNEDAAPTLTGEPSNDAIVQWAARNSEAAKNKFFETPNGEALKYQAYILGPRMA